MHWAISERDYREVAAGLRTAEAAAAVTPQEVDFTPPEGQPIRLSAQAVTANYFDVLGVRLAAGRGFVAAEDRAVVDVVVVGDRCC